MNNRSEIDAHVSAIRSFAFSEVIHRAGYHQVTHIDSMDGN